MTIQSLLLCTMRYVIPCLAAADWCREENLEPCWIQKHRDNKNVANRCSAIWKECLGKRFLIGRFSTEPHTRRFAIGGNVRGSPIGWNPMPEWVGQV
jgi:hypothetical protein